ncbi:glycosyltransferase [Candidatus Bathyarchaeota archaeon]|nr:glycosyltransferase [Candidatus Bathyarchaeota archaeon]
MAVGLKNKFRNTFTYMPRLGLKKKPDFQQEGISFIVPVKDEERWIGASLESIKEVADEIIVIDSSVEDSTTEIVTSMAENNSKIKHIRFYCPGPHAFALACHVGLVNVSYKWVFKWDSDFVGKSTEALYEWKNRLTSLNKDSYYVINLSAVNLNGDLKHQPKGALFKDPEVRIFTWSPELRWALKPNYWEQVTGDSIWGHRFPPWYRVLQWNELYIFHCDIKNPERMFMRQFWADYMIHKDKRFPNVKAYTEYRVRKDMNMTMEEAVQAFMDDLLEGLAPYDEKTFGELPKILLAQVLEPKKHT